MQPAAESFLPFDHWAYGLLLGFYLGDGCVTSTGTSYQLRVILDGLYPEVIEDCVMSITLSLLDEVNVHVRPKPHDRGVIVEASYKRWPAVFPPARARAQPPHRPRPLAASHSRPAAPGFPPRPDPLGRVPDDQPVQ